MFKMSNIQTPYAIAWYWSVHRNPYNWVFVIPIKLGGISYKKNTANNQGFGQSSDVFVHHHSIVFAIFDRSKQITSALAIPSAPVEKPKNGRLQHICCRSGAKIIPIIPSMSLDDFSRFIIGKWKMFAVCNYIVQTSICVCLVIIQCTVCVYNCCIYIYLHYTYGHRHNCRKSSLIVKSPVFNCSGFFYNWLN